MSDDRADSTELLALVNEMGPDELGARLLSMSTDERRSVFARLSPLDSSKVLGKTSHHTLVALGRKAVAGLGTYRALLTKQERLRGKLLEPQSLEI